jgi:hypothetical protein
VYDAVTIEKTFESFMPPRETYTTLSNKEVAEKCAAREFAKNIRGVRE